MGKYLLTTLIVLFFSVSFFAQNRRGTFESQSEQKLYNNFTLFDSKKSFNANLKRQKIGLNHLVLKNLFIQKPKNIAIDFNQNGITKTFYFEKHSIFSDNLKIELSSGEKISPAKINCYKGIVGKDEKSFATMTVGDNFCSILFSDQSGNYEIVKDKNNQYYFMKSPDEQKQECHTEDDGKSIIDQHNNSTTRSVADCLELYVEADNAAYIANGSNVTNTQTWITNIFNNVAVLFKNSDVPIIISQVYIWNTADPYTSATNLTAMRTAFITRLVTLGINGKVGYLLSTRNIGGGGISNGIGGFCNAVNAYPSPCALSTSLATSIAAVPTYSYTIQNVAHELGHVMGLRHSHACVWNGTNTQIDDCGNVIAANSGNTPEGICFNAASPMLPGAAGGTIMSNCSDLSGQSINFANGFGPIIGNALFLNFVNATCITGTSCGTLPPNNDECLDAIPLTLTKTCAVKTYDNKYGTQSANTPLFSCVTQPFYTDVWFTAIIPASGSLTIETKQTASSPLSDMFIQAYSGTCSALTQIACDDDSGDAAHALITLTGRTPGEKIFFRISPKDKPGADDFGEFDVCAYDASLPCHPDFNTLVSFYTATGGPTWTNKTGWSNNATNCDVCNWFGVVCDGAGRVKALNLGFNNLTGTLPSSMTGLTNLSKINMYSNNFAIANLPTFLNSFPLLEYVDLGANKYNGTIPASYSTLPNIRTLYLDNNTLSGTLPSALINTPLLVLWLNNNNFTGCIPNSWNAFCTRNTTIRLEQNTGLPGNGNFDTYCLNGFGGDFDNDGFCGGSADCDDQNNATYPGAAEICDGKDNNCNTSIDEGIPDVTNTWIGAASGNWNVATNWSTGKIPEKCHNVIISPTATNITVTIPNGYAAKASSVNIGANGKVLVQFNAILNVVDKGEVINSGNINSFGAININNPLNTSGVALTNSGTITNNSTGMLNINNAGASAIRNNAGATITNGGNVSVTNNHITNGQYGLDNRGSMTNTGQLIVSNITGKEIRVATGAILTNNSLGTIEVK